MKGATPQNVLTQLYEDYYNAFELGLNRLDCFVESPEMMNSLDRQAKAVLSKVRYEAKMMPDQPIEVKVSRIPAHYSLELRGACEGYAKQLGMMLNQYFGVLNELHQLINPEGVLKDVPMAWAADGKERVIEIPGADHDDINRNDKNVEPLKAGKRSKDQQRQRAKIIFSRDGLPKLIVHNQAEIREVTKLKCRRWKGTWLIEEIDSLKYDDQERLLERHFFRMNTMVKRRLLLPRKVEFKALDSRGRVLKRRSEPNPISIVFSGHQVERR